MNETKFLSNLTLSSFSASAYVANPALEADLGGIEGWGGGKGGPRHNRPKLLHLHRSPPNTCYARGNSGSSPLVRRNVLATTLFIAVVRVNETKFLSNLTLSSFSASAYVANPALEADLGGIEGWGGGPPPPLKGGPRHNRPKLLHLHRSPPNTCYARGNSGSSPLPFET